MKHSYLRLLFGGLGGMLLLSACLPTTVQPTGPSAEEVEAQISTSVAMTIAVYQTGQAALASLSPTPTDTPTLTPSPVFPTLTPFIPSPTKYTGGGGVVFTPAAYACAVINKAPADNTVFKPNKDFDVKFWLRNDGVKTWDAGADLLYNSGTNMLTADMRYELPRVDPGGMVGPFIFDAKSPNKAGTFTMTFKVQGGFCYPYIRIVVKK